MKPVTIDKGEFQDKVFACWLGKKIGGAIGAPHEGQTDGLDVTFIDPVALSGVPNDHLDFQLVWLKMLKEKGIHPKLADFTDYWVKHLAAYPWDELGSCSANLWRGLRAPVCGGYENDFVDHIAAMGRSEIWAIAAPGNPQLAAAMAWKDGIVDHGGGDGLFAEMFLAAIQSAAFVEADPLNLIDIGLQMVPIHCSTARVARAAVWLYSHSWDFEKSRQRILDMFRNPAIGHCAQNLGFLLLGWLYGTDFADKLCKTVNCGYHTDGNCGSLGALLGILGGTAYLTDQWRGVVSESIALHPFTKLADFPKNLSLLTEDAIRITEAVMEERSRTVEFGSRTYVRGNRMSGLRRSDRISSLLDRDFESAVVPASKDVEITMHYMGAPVIYSKSAKLVSVSIDKCEHALSSKIEVVTPPGWKVSLEGSIGMRALFCLTPDEVQSSNQVRVRFQSEGESGQADFVFFGPDNSGNAGPGEGAQTCPYCHARAQCCICGR